jgi:hypothetical protein
MKPSTGWAAGAIVAAIASIVIGLKTVLRLPGLPYNVTELFLDDAHPLALTFFALALLWVGAGAMLVAHASTSSRRPYLALPVALVFVSIASKMLVSRAVTYESLDDILGSNNLFGLVTQQNIWGDWWRRVFLMVNVDAIDFIERRVRYCALYSIPVLCVVAALMPIARRHSGRPHMRRLDAGLFFGTAVAWIGLSATVVLTWAATDNLTELIARPGPFGVPGSVFLLGVVVLLAGHVGVLLKATDSAAGWVAALLFSCVALPAGWVLLNAGLERQVQKYDLVFSGTQFLLGPDRRHALGAGALFARWAVVYVSAVAVIAFGAWLFRVLVMREDAISRRREAAAEGS